MSNGELRMGEARESKMLGLELVRFTCALSVLIWHYQHFYQAAGSPAYVRDAQPLNGLLSLFYGYGQFGVQIFWAISGFIFFWKYGEAIANGAVTGSRFFWLRFSRLYPLHLVTLLLVATLQPIHGALTGGSFVYQNNDVAHFLLQLGMATDWFGPQPFSFNGPIWSVSAEVFVYAAFFLAMRRLGNSPLLIGGAIALSLLVMLVGIISWPIFCAGFFFAGGAAARVLAKSRQAGDGSQSRWLAVLMAVTVLGAAWATGLLGERAVLPFTLMFVTPPLLFLAAQDWRGLERWQRPIQAAGNLTYSSYLCHFPMQLMLAIGAAASGVALPVGNPLFLFGYLTAVLIVARVVFERFERPAQNWIRSFASRRTIAAALV